MPEMRQLEANGWFRIGLHFALLAGFVLAVLSLVLRPGKVLGTTAVACILLAGIIGGSQATSTGATTSPVYFGLDWFVLNVVFTGILFIPLERIWPNRGNQELLRAEWREDLFCYFVSSLMVQVLTFLTFAPAKTILTLGSLAESGRG